MKSSFLTRTVLLLSLVSMLNDVSSEMLYPVMPLFLAQIGFSVFWMGVMEGAIELIAGLSKNYFGAWSDSIGKRMPFVHIGYMLSALSKPLMAFVTAPVAVFSARSLDRLGKGIRTAARDALLADESDAAHRGKVFGFHRAFDTLGATIGPVAALLILHFFPERYSLVFLLAFIPAMAGVLLTGIVVEKHRDATNRARPAFFDSLRYWFRAPSGFKKTTLPLWCFAAINSSDLFLLMKAKTSGIDDTTVIGLYVFYNLVYALAAFPAGRLADRIGFRPMLVAGLVLFSAAYTTLALGSIQPHFATGFFLYGLYAAFSEGVMRAWLSTLVPQNETATAIGCFAAGQSVLALAAGTITGLVWIRAGAVAALLFSAVVTLLLAVYLLQLKTESTTTKQVN